MRFNLDLDFCIIYNPIFYNDSYMIYFTRRDEAILDYSIREEDAYEELLDFMRSMGYFEVDYLTFEFMGEEEGPVKLEVDDMVARLIEKGAKYNLKFEDVVKDTLEAIKKDLDSEYLNQIFSSSKSTKNKLEIIPTRNYKLPEINGRLNMYFYLFLECYFINASEGFLKLTGDFDSRQNTNERNFLRILNTDFVRIQSDREDYYRFETVKSNVEIVKSVSFLQGGYFQINATDHDEENLSIKHSKTVTFFYSILEIKNKLKKNDKIIIEVPTEKFNTMMEISQRIRHENKFFEKETIAFEDITSSFEILKKMGTKKMLEFAEEEDFIKASAIKRDLKTIGTKERFFMENIFRDVSKREYNKLFCFS